ncbi:MAG: 8-oxo-dGTP diphosphatase [Clostridiales bacterium]|jgi:8-oxo-dGTP pyrophosphatase MutT (NUDIX family)|nr:8-oxo-dGTP diphosphatase [Clostridiales bacterium]MDN5282749.1 8-oxo-dGTP diphosphatase [Candidatus Ozemobacter sp.]
MLIGVKQVSSIEKSPEIRIRVTVLLKRQDGKICFVRHRKDGRVYWLLPGGGQDPLESAKDAGKRELFEELQIKVDELNLVFIRESIDPTSLRHIQFMVFEGINPDFSDLQTGIDERVEGYDFFDADEIETHTIYPAMKEDLIRYATNQKIELFKTLEWIP